VVETENPFLDFNLSTGFSTCGNGSVESVELDFGNTMELSAITVANRSSAIVMGQSGKDYSAVVAPEPTGAAMLAISVVRIGRRRRA